MGTTYKFKTRPYKHQVREVKRLLKRGYGGLLWEPGTGKTKTIVDWASILYTKKQLSRVLVVAPLSVLGVWEEEFEAHSPVPIDVRILDAKFDGELEFDDDALQVLVVNYDLVWRRDPYIQSFDPDMVVADESHRIKKPSSRRSRYLRSLNDARYRAILTGTPTPKGFIDLYGQWVFLNPQTFGTRINDFKRRYIIFGGYMNKQIRGYDNVDELKSKVKKDATTLRKDQCLDLPEEVYQSIPVVLEPGVRKQYERLAKEYFLELDSGEVIDAKNVLAKISKLQQITGGWVNTEQGLVQISTAKLKALKDILEDRYDHGDKVVVFARFIPETDAIREVAKEVGYRKVYMLRGDVPQTKRDIYRREFQTTDSPAVFVVQIQSGGLGITLHAAHEAIFYSVTYSLDEYIQARGRIHRSGQKHKVTYRHLVGVGTIDRDIYAALRAKKKIEELIMGNPSILVKGAG